MNKLKLCTMSMISFMTASVLAMDSDDFESLKSESEVFLTSGPKSTEGEEDRTKRKCWFDETINNDTGNRIGFFCDLKALANFSRTCTKFNKYLMSPHVYKKITQEKVDAIIAQNENFWFCSLIFTPDQVNLKQSHTFLWQQIEQLNAAINLGDARACLALAEMNWSSQKLQNLDFIRRGLYVKALRLKKPDTQKAWFKPCSPQYNAACLGLARLSLKTMTPHELGSSKKLEGAVEAIVCITDASYFKAGAVVMTTLRKLWTGHYERNLDQRTEQQSGDPSQFNNQRPRTLEEKTRDFKLMAAIIRHGKKLGIKVNQLDQHFGGMDDNIYLPSLHGPGYHTYCYALADERQMLMFLAQGGANVMPDRDRY